MNFDFSDDQRSLQSELRRFLADTAPIARARKALEQGSGFDRALWVQMAELGWLGIAIPERFGGSGLGALELALAAEEVGRVLAPIPFGSSICGAAETIVRDGNEVQQARWLPGLASGEEIGVLAVAERPGAFDPLRLECQFDSGRVNGTKLAVADAGAATFALVACSDGDEPALVLVAIDQPGVSQTALTSIDPSRSVATLVFADAEGERIGDAATLDATLTRMAVLQAFEQIGGADASFAMTREFMDFRQAFGKSISSYQALKHRMADLYTSLELARANAYYAAWALSAGSPELGEAAACARVAATDTFALATVESIQLHGGIGFTWESDCHLYYRRAKWLAASLGAADMWRERLVRELDAAIA